MIIKNDPIKGNGLYANHFIKKGNIISYYKMKVFKYKTYNSPTNNIYTFTIYTPKGNPSRTFVGDIVEESLMKPYKGIPYWGYLANEPSGDQTENCEVMIEIKKNIKENDYVVYRLIALKNIPIGDEIVWYYGDHYARDYELPSHIR